MTSFSLDTLNLLAQECHNRGVNIAESYADWLTVGFSCAHFGEGGRSAFHAFSAVSGKYEPRECDRQFDACLRGGGETKSPAPLLSLCKSEGVLLSELLRARRAAAPVRGSVASPSDVAAAPLSSPCPSLAPFAPLRELAPLADSPALLPSVLWSFCAGLAACVPSLHVCYSGKWQSCALYFCLAAPAASGKGVLSDVQRCFSAWHRLLRAESESEWRKFRETKRATKKEDRDLLQEPPLFSLFLPADTTTSALMQTISDNNGGGLMWESELDTLTRTFKSEWGNFSDILRNNYHGEPLRSNRKGGRVLLELIDTHFSCVLSGTLRQVGNFFRSAENGLLSRFAFSLLPPSLEWREQWGENNRAEVSASVGAWVESLACAARVRECRVIHTAEQRREHTRNWSEWQAVAYEQGGDEVISVVRRLALMQVRLSAVLTICEDGQIYGGEVVCSSRAWKLAEWLCRQSLDDAVAVLTLMPEKDGQATKKEQERAAVLAALPPRFTLADLPPSLSPASRYRWVGLWERSRAVVKVSEGVWQKIN